MENYVELGKRPFLLHSDCDTMHAQKRYYYGFVNGKLVTVDSSIIDARQYLIDYVLKPRNKVMICSDRAGKNPIEYLRSINADDYPDAGSPVQSRRKGMRRWRSVTADGEIY